MPNTLLHKRGTSKPSPSDLLVGEIAINTAEGKLFTENDSGYIWEAGELLGTFSSSTITYTVTVASKTSSHRYNGQGSSLGYKINGVFSPFLTLTPGNTYRFDQSDSSNSNHPLKFYLESDKSTLYSTGVTINGTAGQSGAYTEITIGDTTPLVLHYQCGFHGYMGNAVFCNSKTVNYNDLQNKPSLFSGNYNDLSNKPSLFSGNYNDLSNKPSLFSGSYNDLSNKPTIPTLTSQLTNDAGFVTVSGGLTDGDKGDIVVASSGDSLLVDDGVIDNANIASNAAIAGSKINPDFGSQNITTTGNATITGLGGLTISNIQPRIHLTDTNNNPDYFIDNNSGNLRFYDNTNSALRLRINAGGVLVSDNLEVGAGLDVTGSSTFLASTEPQIVLQDSDSSNTGNAAETSIQYKDGGGTIQGQIGFHDVNSSNLFIDTLNTSHNILCRVGGSVTQLRVDNDGIDVTGNITATGTLSCGGLANGTQIQAGNPTLRLRSTGNSFGNKGTIEFYQNTDNFCARIKGSARNSGNGHIRLGVEAAGTMTDILLVDDAGIDVTGNITATGTIDGVLKNGVTATTQSANDNSTKVATTAYTDTAISNLINNSPSALDTLKELSDALGADANFSTTVTNSIATKLPLAGGTLTGDLSIEHGGHPKILLHDTNGNNQCKIQFQTDSYSWVAGLHGGENRWKVSNSDTHGTNDYLEIDSSGNLYIHNNIVVGGTVDGRDLAADGSKLDGIAAGATNVTNNNQLTNGAGYITSADGGNAATLDNIDSSQFLRSDQNDSASGTLSLNGRVNIGDGLSRPSALDSDADAHCKIGGSDVHLYVASLGAGGGYKVAVQAARDTDFASFTLNLQSNGGELQRGGNKVWDAGNDGAGSGLDSDLLDGQQGSHYLDYNNFSNTPTIPTNNNQLTNGAGYITSAALAGASDGGNAALLDGIDSTQFLRADQDDTTTGKLTLNSSNNEKIVLAGSSNPFIRWQESTGHKAYIQWNSSGFFGIYNQEDASSLRIKDSIDFSTDGSTYHSIWHAGNDGSGSGLDADKLDGVQASGFFQQSGSWAGDLTSNGFTRENGLAMTGGAEFVILSKSGQGHVLIDGSYHAYEGGAFYSYQNSSFSSQVGFFADSSSSAKWKGHLKPNADSSQDLGSSSLRWSNVYADTLYGDGANITNISGDAIQNLTIDSSELENNCIITDKISNSAVTNAKIASVDVSKITGNINATTLDGIDSSSFLRSDTSDDFNGVLTIHSSGTNNYGQIRGYNNDNHFIVIRGQVTTGQSSLSITGGHKTTFVEHAENNDTTGWYFLSRQTGNYTEIARITRTGGIHLQGNKVFHAGNDGSGSGLDADKLDGQEGSYYLNYNNLSNKPSIPAAGVPASGGTFTGDVTFSGGAAAINISSSDIRSSNNSDWTGNPGSGALKIQAHSDRWYIVSNTNSNRIVQFRQNSSDRTWIANDGQIYHGSGGTGDKYWRQGNDGSGSGLDSDTVDGIQASSFLRSDANDTLSAKITGHASNTEVLSVRSSTYSSKYVYIGGWSTANSNDISRIRTSGNLHIDSPANGDLYLNHYSARTIRLGNSGTTVYAAGSNVVWHAANDGSGSGLDSDTVDGLQASSFVRSDANDTMSGQLTISRGANNQIVLNRNIGSPSNYYNDLQMEIRATTGTAGIGLHRSGHSHVGIYTYAANRLDFDFNGGDVVLNHTAGTIWGSGNDGSGSNLDADKLDGYQASDFARKSETVNFTSKKMGLGTNLSGSFNGRNAALALGDSDTGVAQNGDGQLELWANNQECVNIDTSRTIHYKELCSTQNVVAYYSDERLKEKLGNIQDALVKVNQIETFFYRENKLAKEFGFNKDDKQLGVSAQSVEKVVPEVVALAPFDYEVADDGSVSSKSGKDYKTVDYGRLVPLLIESIKELTNKVKVLENKLNVE